MTVQLTALRNVLAYLVLLMLCSPRRKRQEASEFGAGLGYLLHSESIQRERKTKDSNCFFWGDWVRSYWCK